MQQSVDVCDSTGQKTPLECEEGKNPLTLLNYSDCEKHTVTVKTPLTITKMIKELNVNAASD